MTNKFKKNQKVIGNRIQYAILIGKRRIYFVFYMGESYVG